MNFGLMHAEIKKSFELSQLNLMGKVIIKRMSNKMFLSANIVLVVDQAHLGRWMVMVGLVKILKAWKKLVFCNGSLLTIPSLSQILIVKRSLLFP